MARPTDAPKRWAYDGTADKVDAAAAFAEIGFVDNDPSRNDWLNWAMYTYGEWLEFIKRGGEVIPIAPATAAVVDATGGTVTTLIPGIRLVAGATVPGQVVLTFQTVFAAGTATKVSVSVNNITAAGTLSVEWAYVISSTTSCATAARNYTAADNGTVVDQPFTLGTLGLAGPGYIVGVVSFSTASDAIDFDLIQIHIGT